MSAAVAASAMGRKRVVMKAEVIAGSLTWARHRSPSAGSVQYARERDAPDAALAGHREVGHGLARDLLADRAAPVAVLGPAVRAAHALADRHLAGTDADAARRT